MRSATHPTVVDFLPCVGMWPRIHGSVVKLAKVVVVVVVMVMVISWPRARARVYHVCAVAQSLLQSGRALLHPCLGECPNAKNDSEGIARDKEFEYIIDMAKRNAIP